MADELVKIKEPKLTLKQRNWLKYYFETGNSVQSAMKAYNTKNYGSAAAIGTENLQKLKPRMQTFMELHGLSLGTLVNKVASKLEAKKNGNEDDNMAQLKAVEIAGKWLGAESQEIKDGLTRKLTIEEWIK